MTRFVRVTDVLHLADVAVDGAAMMRDLGLIDSAVARPQAAFAGEAAYPTVHLKAAALLDSLIRNHGLVDGNKRTAVLSVMFFYLLNGWTLSLGEDDWFDLAVGVAAGEVELAKIADTLSGHADQL
ncbi:MAG: type II toxin-antitoxin system death-on-curing family toxin [Acidimicrobiales bacterium]